MCYCTLEPLVGGFTPKAGIFFYHIFNLLVIKKKEHKHIALHMERMYVSKLFADV